MPKMIKHRNLLELWIDSENNTENFQLERLETIKQEVFLFRKSNQSMHNYMAIIRKQHIYISCRILLHYFAVIGGNLIRRQFWILEEFIGGVSVAMTRGNSISAWVDQGTIIITMTSHERMTSEHQTSTFPSLLKGNALLFIMNNITRLVYDHSERFV